MDEVKIPEDLTVHHKATKANRHNVGTWSDMFVRGLIERIAHAEAQVAEADFNFGGWRAIKKRLEAQVAALEAQLTRIKEWCDAYPLEQFPEPDMQRFLIALGPQLLSELSAHNYRHVLNGIKAIIDESAAPGKEKEVLRG